jgi:hypothetical protein
LQKLDEDVGLGFSHCSGLKRGGSAARMVHAAGSISPAYSRAQRIRASEVRQ